MTTDVHGAVPIALPFDDEGDAPVPFTLTAAAHRALDPADVPGLRVVPDRPAASPAPPTSEEVDDLRPAQARALRRSGMRAVTIAAAMGVDVDLVTTWTADLAAVPRERVVPLRTPDPRPAQPVAAGPIRLGSGRSAAGIGLAVALARIDADGRAVTLIDDRPAVLAAALRAVRSGLAPAPGTVRVAARVGPDDAIDRWRADLARVLEVPADRVVVGRRHGAASADRVEITVRIVDARLAGLLDAWAGAVVGPDAAVAVGG